MVKVQTTSVGKRSISNVFGLLIHFATVQRKGNKLEPPYQALLRQPVKTSTWDGITYST